MSGPGLAAVFEYIVRIETPGSNFIDLVSPGSRGLEAALRIFDAVASSRREHGGYLNLIAYPGADHDTEQGLILKQHRWGHGDD